MTEGFGLMRVGSAEVFFDDSIGWCIRVFSAPSRSGQTGTSVSSAADDMLSVATLSTLPTLLAHEGYTTTGNWHVDNDSRTAWIDVVPQNSSQHHDQPSHDSVDAILDAELRWERDGIGRQTPRG